MLSNGKQWLLRDRLSLTAVFPSPTVVTRRTPSMPLVGRLTPRQRELTSRSALPPWDALGPPSTTGSRGAMREQRDEQAWTEAEWERMWPMPSRETPSPEPTHPWARMVDDQDEWPGWKEFN